MSFFNLFKIALKVLRRNILRAFLTMLGIIIGVGSVITRMSIGEGSKKSIGSTFSSMGTNMIPVRPYSNIPMPGGVRMGSSNIQTLTLNDVEKIGAEVKNISALSPGLSSGRQAIRGSKNWPTSIQGVGRIIYPSGNWK